MAPARAARMSSGTVATAVRPNTTTGGAMCSTATLMNRYGTPQMAPMAANRVQLRRSTRRESWVLIAPRRNAVPSR